MLRSMTGYGTAEGMVGGRKLVVDFKAVNHRYFNFFSKLPPNLAILETNIQSLAKAHLSRGQVSVFASWDRRGGQGASAELNFDTARAVHADLLRLKEELKLGGEIKLSHLLACPSLFAQSEAGSEPEELWEGAKPIFEAALKDLDSLRLREGADLEADLRRKLSFLMELAARIEAKRPEIVAEQKERLQKRIGELVPEVIIDATASERLALEIAIFADKADVNEELVRLKSHVDKFLELISSDAPVGRKVDFLIQEMNREINTIGSKTPDAESSAIVVEMKSELERLREQIQNVE